MCKKNPKFLLYFPVVARLVQRDDPGNQPFCFGSDGELRYWDQDDGLWDSEDCDDFYDEDQYDFFDEVVYEFSIFSC